jgi:hypothetical protein
MAVLGNKEKENAPYSPWRNKDYASLLQANPLQFCNEQKGFTVSFVVCMSGHPS